MKKYVLVALFSTAVVASGSGYFCNHENVGGSWMPWDLTDEAGVSDDMTCKAAFETKMEEADWAVWENDYCVQWTNDNGSKSCTYWGSEATGSDSILSEEFS